MAVILSSCEKEEVKVQTETQNLLTAEQQKMRSALETTTNILLDMVAKDPSYFDELNNLIIAGSPEYLEDRVMLKDLFNTTPNSSTLRIKANTNRFTSDFRSTFNNQPRKVGGVNGVKPEIFTNPDSLIQFLTLNNVSLYCPFPIEEYDEDNRIPAITFHPMNNDTVNVGYMLTDSGSFKEVQVCQAYNDLHPVWILIPYELCSYENNVQQQRVAPSAPNEGFELIINSIYCTNYYGANLGIFSVDMDIRILRSSSSFSWNDQTKDFVGTFQLMKTFRMPRKYVTWARQGSMSGWFPVYLTWDYNWTNERLEQALSIYEHDDSQNEMTITSTAKFTKKDVGEIGVTVSGKISNRSDIITLEPIGRNYVYNIAKYGHKDVNGNIDWTWRQQTFPFFWKNREQFEGNYIYRINPDFLMTISVID